MWRLFTATAASVLCLVFSRPAVGCQEAPRGGSAEVSSSRTERDTNQPGQLRKGQTEWGLLAIVGIAHDRGDVAREFLTFGGHIGRILTDPIGPGFLNGDFEIAVDVLPVFLMFQESTVYGFSSTLLFRQYFSPGRRLRPFFSFGAGVLLSNNSIPPQSNGVNFTPQGGVGVVWFREPGLGYLFEYRFHHISNAGLSHPNPGINSSVFQFGVSLFR